MQNAADPPRRLGRPAAHAASNSITANHEVATSNQTSNYFLGTSQRSWMRPTITAPSGPPNTTRQPGPRDLSARMRNPPRDQPANDAPVASAADPPHARDAPLPAGDRPGPGAPQAPPVRRVTPEQPPPQEPEPRQQATPGQQDSLARASASRHTANPVAVVDLTMSQGDAVPHGPSTVPGQSLLQSRQSATSATAATRTVRSGQNMAPGDDAVAQSAQERRLSNSALPPQNKAFRTPVPGHATSAQLLTPAASPVNQPLQQVCQPLLRKRTGADLATVGPSASRVRTHSPQTRAAGAEPIGAPVAPAQNSAQPQPASDLHPNTRSAAQMALGSGTLPPHAVSTRPGIGGHQRAASQPDLAPEQRLGTPQLAPPVQGGARACLATFNTTVDEMSAHVDLRGLPHLRIAWIRTACRCDDLFFLLLNQLWCTWHLNKQLLAVTARLDRTCDGGFAVLDVIFGSNAALPPQLLAYLAGWPNSSNSFHTSPELSHWIGGLARFLPILASIWPDLRQKCLLRGCPPAPRELTEHYNFPPSPTLASAVFSVLARHLHPSLPQAFHDAAFHLFTAYSQGQVMQPGLVNGPNQPPRLDAAADALRFGARYRELLANFCGGVHGTTAPVVNPHTGTMNYHSSNGPHPRSLTLPSFQAQHPGAMLESHASPVAARLPNSASITPRRTSMPGSSDVLSHVTPTPGLVPSRFDSTGRGPPQAQFLRQQTTAPSASAGAPSLPTHSAPLSSPDRTWITARHTVPEVLMRQPLLPDMRNLPPFLTNPLPEQEALHLAHLRPPTTVVRDTKPGETTRLYQFIQSCPLKPLSFRPDVHFLEIDFHLPPHLVANKAQTTHPPETSFRTCQRVLTKDALLFNLRCAQRNPRDPPPTESDWAASHTYYPQHIFISLNDQDLELRRKRHHRKDLPVDVTEYVQAGDNKVTVSIFREQGDEGKEYAIAVEIIGVHDHAQAFAMPDRVSVEESLSAIRRAMHPPTPADDDDMQVLNDSVTISVTDPFTSTIFTVPVKGKQCKHRECFDLETFLRSRPTENNDILTSVYVWQCPICSKDARPSNLLIDGFLRQVRDELERAGNLDARAIVVDRSGSWTVKQEDEGEASRNGSRPSSGQPGRSVEKSDGVTDAGAGPNTSPSHVTATQVTGNRNVELHTSRVHEIVEID